MKIRSFLPLFAGAIALACSEIDPLGPEETTPPGAATITTDITTSRIFHAETTYTLSGFIKVANGATLTIEPGTKIVGDYVLHGKA